MKHKFIPFLLVLLMGISFSNTTKESNDIVYAAEATADYYDNGDLSVKGLKGDNLINKLATLMQETHTKYTKYGDLRQQLADSDKDPNKEGNILDFYSQISFSATWDGGTTWNREHVWPQSVSKGLYEDTNNSTLGAGGDIHHIRPTFSSINSSRGNKPYNELDEKSSSVTEYSYKGTKTGNYYDSKNWEPASNVKGDVARILMYMYTHYSTGVTANELFVNASDLEITDVVIGSGQDQAAWNVLMQWNLNDPVDDFEKNRNEVGFKLTGVRNPYIDHPEFAGMIWDSSYNGPGALLDSEIGGGSTTPGGETAITGIVLDKTSVTILEGNQYVLIATVMPTSAKAEVTWTSSNNEVATVSDGIITAVKTGNTIITASAGGYSAQCIVLVDKAIISNNNNSKGCGKASVSVVTMLSILTVLGIVILKKKD